MQYYICEGFINDEKWVKENDSATVKEQRDKELNYKTSEFNRKQQGKVFFYPIRIKNSEVKIGAIAITPLSIEDKLSSFLKALKLGLKDIHIEETTFDKTETNLIYSCRNGSLRIQSDDYWQEGADSDH